MTVTADPGLDFWLDYVTAEGGLHERVGAATLVVLPEALQERHDRESEMTVTADPDVAREDRATLMTVGHPLLTAAAESVLSEGDVGLVRLPPAGGRRPDLTQLQDWARDRITVDHGRVDLTGGPHPSIRYLVRVSSLTTFTMSSDDRFQEQIECWIDMPSGLPLPGAAHRVLAPLVEIEHTERGQLDPGTPGLAGALIAADTEIRRRSEIRRKALGDSVLPAYRGERDRARDYYDQMAASLRKRMSAAASEKVEGYRSRLEHCQAERDRRLAEIEEKYRSSAEILPFRLHLIGVPALRVEAGVRRGNRWYPVDLEWLSAIRQFAPIACPGCASDELLVAGKDGLGCRRCRPPRALGAVPDPAPVARATRGATTTPGATVTPGASDMSPTPGAAAALPTIPTAPIPPGGPGPTTDPAAQASSGSVGPKAGPTAPRASSGSAGPKAGSKTGPPGGRAKPAASRGAGSKTVERTPSGSANRPQVRVLKPPSTTAMVRAGEKLIVRLWDGVEQGSRDVGRMCAADGPAAALVQVYGSAGPRVAIGVRDGVRLLNVAGSPSVSVPGTDYWLTAGRLGASDRADHPFQVLWHHEGGGPRIDEIVGAANGIWPWLPWERDRFGLAPGLWSVPPTVPETAAMAADPVASLVLGTTRECQGTGVAARCLAAWWRIDPEVGRSLVEQVGPEAVAAALDKLVSRQAYTFRRGDLELAGDHGVEAAVVKSTAARLQRRLGLSSIRPW